MKNFPGATKLTWEKVNKYGRKTVIYFEHELVMNLLKKTMLKKYSNKSI